MKEENYIWDLFTAKEEYKDNFKDKFNRNTYWSSTNRNIFTPVVSEFLSKKGFKSNYPDGKKFALCLTHDVDNLFKAAPSLKENIKSEIKSIIKLDIPEAYKIYRSRSKREINPIWNISKLLKVEKKYNAKSSFYFLSLSNDEQDFNYEVSEIMDMYDLILQSKGEIGLHGGHLAYNNSVKISEEKKKLEAAIGQPVYGYRNHYLHFETPVTWQHLSDLHFKYDTTYGYADCVGFRNGMVHPFNPYTLNKNVFLDIIELPLVIMDCSLWKYMNVNINDQFNICKKLIDSAVKNSGVLTLLWHNTEMDGFKGELYEAILKYANDEGAWMTTGNEIVDFWKENNFHSQVLSILEEAKRNIDENIL